MNTTLWLLILGWFPHISPFCTVHDERLLCEKRLENLDTITEPIRILQFQHLETKILDLAAILRRFPETENISIYGGTIEKIATPQPNNSVKVLEMMQIGVENIGSSFLRKFPALEVLNLQGNYLQTWTVSKEVEERLKALYLSDNHWNCSLALDWVLSLNRTLVKDFHNLTCYGAPHPNKPLATIAEFMHDITTKCPKSCNCTLPKVILTKIGSDQLEPVIEVNCSYRALTELPQDLLPKTRIIHLEGNEIEDLKLIKYQPVYEKAFEIYLDNNRIKTIEELEGAYFLRHFRVFSLSGNKLSEIPTYALDHSIDQNENMPEAVRLSLGNNPWRCDCVFTPVFQEFLRKFDEQILDITLVKCSYIEGDENSLLPIAELSRSSVCTSPTEYSVQALDLLNIVLASLIVLILGKLAYDYYHFKKTGRLPWIVTKMP